MANATIASVILTQVRSASFQNDIVARMEGPIIRLDKGRSKFYTLGMITAQTTTAKWIARFTIETRGHSDRGFACIEFETPTPNLIPISPNDCEHGVMLRGLTISQRLIKTDGKFAPDPQGPVIAYLDLQSATLPKLKQHVKFLESIQDNLDQLESKRGEVDSFGCYVQRVLTILDIDRLNIGKQSWTTVQSMSVLDYEVNVLCAQLNGELRDVASDQPATD